MFFKKLRSALDKDELHEMGAAVEAFKENRKGSPPNEGRDMAAMEA